jgi:dimethylamine/trimethylamine dehydrogenase
MSRDQRFDVLFEPVQIGPVTAPNRFYQVPHCTGMGYGAPRTLAAMRGVKAEGGWGVVNTEYCSIHPTSDDMPLPHASLWDEDDVRNMALMTEEVHAHGALAGVELWHGGIRSSNLYSRRTPFGPVSLPTVNDPLQCQKMDKSDIVDLRAWHRAAALRAREAGYDIAYVYPAHTYLLAQFLDPVINTRNDEYGGSAENRARLFREILEDTKEAIGADCAIAVRVEVDRENGTGREECAEMISSIRHLPDLFDVTVADYGHEMGVSRFVNEASLESSVAHIRELTGKPVVSVGRFTSPETMLGQIKRGVLDFVGAARPSIADPFLPTKIREGRFEDIRECIGCNICYAGDYRGVPIRCTQNPAMGEEWRRGWHPENVPVSTNAKEETALIVGGGPAGLEAAHILGKRGVQVMLAEATGELGGRVSREAKLPGLAEWARVRDYRVQQISTMINVELFPGSQMGVDDILATGAAHVFLATGSRWRKDGRGRHSPGPVAGFEGTGVLSPDDIMDGSRPSGHVLVYDDDHYYMGSVLAELLVTEKLPEKHKVTYVTTAGRVSSWSSHTAEQGQVHSRLLELGVDVVVNHAVSGFGASGAELTCVFSGAKTIIKADSLVPVTSREPNDQLWTELSEKTANTPDKGIKTLIRIGDCKAPGIIAMAVYDGHRAAREFDMAAHDIKVLRDRVVG